MRKSPPKPSPSSKRSKSSTIASKEKSGLHVVLPSDLLESIRALAFFDRTTVTSILSNLIGSHLKSRKADLRDALSLYRVHKD
jgi:hypothetical protein